MTVYKQWFYGNPKCRGEDDGPPADPEERVALVDAEERVLEAKAVFRVRLNAYEDAEARACSRTFAASLADDAAREARERADADRRVAVDAHDRTAAEDRAADRAAVARSAADCALEAVRVRGRALAQAMDDLAEHAALAGVRLPASPEPGRPDGDGRIVFMDGRHPYYHVYDVRDEEQDVDHGRDDFYGAREP